MDHMELDIYNILLDFLPDDKAIEATDAIINYIRDPSIMKKNINCIEKENKNG